MHKPSAHSTPSLILEENHALPLVRVQVTLQTGAATDALALPALGVKKAGSLPGLCNFATELQRRGAAGRSRAQLEEAVDNLGASVHVLCWPDQVLYEAVALREHIDKACAILADVLLRPDFPADEAERLRRELEANLDELREDEASLAQRFLARELYGATHPYGLPVGGTEKTVADLTLDQASGWVREFVRMGNVTFGIAGDLSRKESEALLARHFTTAPNALPDGPAHVLAFPDPPPRPRKLRVQLVDKPHRTQSQIYFSQPVPHWSDPDFLPLHVATNALGGTFTARLMDEVRTKRGLSYGASARLGTGRGKKSLTMHVFPSSAQTAETVELILRLYTEWADAGLRKGELEFSKSYLQNSHAFSVQTADDRLALRSRLLLCGLPEDYAHTFPARIEAVSGADVKRAMQRHIRPDSLAITLVATAKSVLSSLEKIPALKSADLDVVPFDSF